MRYAIIALLLAACGSSSADDVSSDSARATADAGSALVIWMCVDQTVRDAGPSPPDPVVDYCAPVNDNPRTACDMPKLLCVVRQSGSNLDLKFGKGAPAVEPATATPCEGMCEHGP